MYRFIQSFMYAFMHLLAHAHTISFIYLCMSPCICQHTHTHTYNLLHISVCLHDCQQSTYNLLYISVCLMTANTHTNLVHTYSIHSPLTVHTYTHIYTHTFTYRAHVFQSANTAFAVRSETTSHPNLYMKRQCI